MNQTVSRILWIVAGALLIVAGIVCLANPGLALVTTSLYLGISMLISGIIDIVVFAKGNGNMAGSRLVSGRWHPDGAALPVSLASSGLYHAVFALHLRHVAVGFRDWQICQLF